MKVFCKMLDFLIPLFYFGKWHKKFEYYYVNNVNEDINNTNTRARFKLRVNSADKLIIWEVWKTKEYKKFLMKKDAVIVDIGAHI